MSETRPPGDATYLELLCCTACGAPIGYGWNSYGTDQAWCLSCALRDHGLTLNSAGKSETKPDIPLWLEMDG